LFFPPSPVSLYGAAVRLQVGIGAFSIVYLIFFLLKGEATTTTKSHYRNRKENR